MYYQEDRPWGKFETFAQNQKCTVKILTIKENARVSLQSHQKRDEAWTVLDGHPQIIIDNQTHNSKPGDRFEIKRGQIHRLVGPGKILEVSYGEFDENDIKRYEDDYNRT